MCATAYNTMYRGRMICVGKGKGIRGWVWYLFTFNSSINSGVAFSTVNSLCKGRGPAKHAVDSRVPPCRSSGLKAEVNARKTAMIRRSARTIEFMFLVQTASERRVRCY